MTMQDLVARALAAIHADAPDYTHALRELSCAPELPQLLEAPQADELLRELRKLRPVALWVRDEASLALSTKRALWLDGAICREGPAPRPQAAEGRECWLEIGASWTEETLRALPRGFGLIVAGESSAECLTRLRRLGPLRALGVACRTSSELPNVRLDLVLLESFVPVGEEGGARRLCGQLAPEQLTQTHLDGGLSGLVCDGAQALSFALRLAAHRPARAPRAAP